MVWLRRLAFAALVLATAGPLSAQTHVLGDWHGVLNTPSGGLTLIVTISRDSNGVLQAQLESPDQAPGRKIPITSVEATDDHLTLVIQAIMARYEADWVPDKQHWSGTFTQGLEIPFVLERGLPEARPVIRGLDGTWEGSVQRNEVDLRLVVRVRSDEGGSVALFDAPDVPAFNLPVSSLARTGDRVSFLVPSSGATFDGTLSDDGSRMTGAWRLPGRPEADVTFVRADRESARAARPRPQTPKPPFDYVAEDVTFTNPWAEGVTLAGTLTLPHGAGPFPAAVLISGSGAQDRDETLFDHKPFAVLADHLTRNGIAVLRYDDRGYGESTGDFRAATTADFAADANAAVRYLSTRPEIARDRIGLIGHSEGAMAAPIAVVENDVIAFVVSLAGPGTRTTQLMRSQRRLMALSQGASEEELERIEPIVARIDSAVVVSSDKADAERRVRRQLTEEALQVFGVPESRLDLVIGQFTSDWYRYFLQYDPARYLSRVGVPVLALNGTLDIQVPADENLPAIREALKGNQDVTIRKLDGLNHLFQPAETGALGEYPDITTTLDPVVLEVITEWICRRYGSTAS